MTSGAPVWAREHAARLRRTRIDHKKFTERMDILMTIYPPRSDRNSRHQVVQCSRCGEDVLVPYCGPIPRRPVIHKDHWCAVTAVPYVYNCNTEPGMQRWVIIWVSVA